MDDLEHCNTYLYNEEKINLHPISTLRYLSYTIPKKYWNKIINVLYVLYSLYDNTKKRIVILSGDASCSGDQYPIACIRRTSHL